MVIEPSLERVREARELLHGHFGATRVVEPQFLARRTGKRLRLKLETQSRTGSFKVRGALWTLATALRKGWRRVRGITERRWRGRKEPAPGKSDYRQS